MVITTKTSQTLSVRLKQKQNHTHLFFGFPWRRSLDLHKGCVSLDPGSPFYWGFLGKQQTDELFPSAI